MPATAGSRLSGFALGRDDAVLRIFALRQFVLFLFSAISAMFGAVNP
jgi:hypothetical protein